MIVRLLTVLVLIAFLLVVMIMVKYPGTAYRAIPASFDKELDAEGDLEWRELHSAIGGFKVSMPGQPQHAVESLPIPNTGLSLDYNMYVSEEGDGTTVMVSLIIYPDAIDTSNEKAMLESIMNDLMASDPGNRLGAMNFSTFNGYQSLDFRIENKDIVMLNKTFLVGKKLFLLTLIDKTRNFKEEEFSRLVDSFQFVN